MNRKGCMRNTFCYVCQNSELAVKGKFRQGFCILSKVTFTEQKEVERNACRGRDA